MLLVRSSVIFFLPMLSTSVAIRQHLVGEALLGNHRDMIVRINEELQTIQNPDEGMAFLAGKVPDLRSALMSEGVFFEMQNLDEFAEHYMREYSLTDKASVKKDLKDDGNTGMTGPSGNVYVMTTEYTDHDIVHEIVHTLRGGPSNQLEGNQGIDECFTEYYTKVLCRLLNIPDSPNAYKQNVDFMRRLEDLLQRELGNAKEVLFETFWKRNNVDSLVGEIVKIQIEKARHAHWDENPSYYVKNSIDKYREKVNKNEQARKKNPKKKTKPPKSPKMIRNYATFLQIDTGDLTTLNIQAKKQLLNWKQKKSQFFWETILGIEPSVFPGFLQKNKKKSRRNRKKKEARRVSGSNLSKF
jgi:hypothetical protein